MAPKKRVAKRTYNSYFAKILKASKPDLGLRSKSLYVLNALVEDLETRLTEQASKVAKLDKKSTLSSAHVQCAARMLIPGTLGDQAVAKGYAAVKKLKEL